MSVDAIVPFTIAIPHRAFALRCERARTEIADVRRMKQSAAAKQKPRHRGGVL